MNNKTNYFAVLLMILVFAVGCKKDDDSEPIANSALDGKLEVLYGNNQSGHFGELLADSIMVKASSNSPNRRYLIQYEMVRGNGTLEEENCHEYMSRLYLDSLDVLNFKWRLGGNYNDQQIKLKLYLDSIRDQYGFTRYYSTACDSLIISANGTILDGWVRASGYGNLYYHSSKIFAHENTYYLINDGLFRSFDHGLNWEEVQGLPSMTELINAQCNSHGWVYLATREKGVCYSKDLVNWEFINNGVIDHRFLTTLLVEDTAMFVNYQFDGLYKTTNNGDFWQKLFVSSQAGSNCHDLRRHPNGDLYLLDNWDYFWLSKDYGNTWDKQQIANQYTQGILTDYEFDMDGYMYIGSDEGIISKISTETFEGEMHDFSAHGVHDIAIIDNTAYFIVYHEGVSGIYSSANWEKLDIGFENIIYNYYLKPDGTFLLIAKDGVYYYN